MGLAEAALLRGESALEQRLGALDVAAIALDPRQVAKRRGCLGMLFAEHLAERLDHRGVLRAVGIALRPSPGSAGAVQTDLEGLRMLRAEGLPEDREGGGEGRVGRRPILEVGMENSDRVLGARGVGVGLSELLPAHAQRLAIGLRGGGIVAGLAVSVAQQLDHGSGGCALAAVDLHVHRACTLELRDRLGGRAEQQREVAPRLLELGARARIPLGERLDLVEHRRGPSEVPRLRHQPGELDPHLHAPHQQRGSLCVLSGAQGPLAVAEQQSDSGEGLVRLHDLEPAAGHPQCAFRGPERLPVATLPEEVSRLLEALYKGGGRLRVPRVTSGEGGTSSQTPERPVQLRGRRLRLLVPGRAWLERAPSQVGQGHLGELSRRVISAELGLEDRHQVGERSGGPGGVPTPAHSRGALRGLDRARRSRAGAARQQQQRHAGRGDCCERR
jgi:hypothetical protein